MAKKSKKIKNKECLEYVDDLLTSSRKFYKPLHKKWNTFEYLYAKGAAKKNTPRGRANLELPIAFQQIEPFVDQLSELLLGEAPYIKYVGRNKEDLEASEEITNFTQWQTEIGELYPEARKYFRNLGKLGNAVMKINWEEDSTEIELEPDEYEFDMETGEPKEYIQDRVTFDGPRFYNISLFSFIIPKGVDHCNVQKMPWVAHRVYRTPEELLDNDNYKMAHAKIKKMIGKKDNKLESNKPVIRNDSDKEVSKEAGVALFGQGKDLDKKNQGKWEIIEWWGMYNLGKGRKEPALIAVAHTGEDDALLLRKEPNPFKYKFKPFTMSYNYPVEGESYGYGELNHIKGLISESTALRNARLDRTNISLHSMWLVERTSGVNLRDLYTAPDKIVLCDDKEAIEKLEHSGASQASVEELARIDYDIQSTTEILNPRQDVSNVGAAFGRTATGISYLASRGQLRSVIKAKLLQYTFIKPLARILLWYNREFIGTEEGSKTEYRVSDTESNPFRELDNTSFLSDVDFVPESSPIKATRAERSEDLAYLMQTIAQVEGVVPGTVNFRELLLESFKLKGYPHPDKFLNPEGPTTVIDDGQGNLLDEKGQPVNVVPIEQVQGDKGGQQ